MLYFLRSFLFYVCYKNIYHLVKISAVILRATIVSTNLYRLFGLSESAYEPGLRTFCWMHA